MSRIRLFQVDAFADGPFTGNPAAVCLLNDAARDERWMQAVAAEMNLSETAFVSPGEDGFELRWFTPTVEVALCGHATLAAAHVLWEEGLAAEDQAIRFHTQSGALVCRKRAELVELDFPACPVSECPPVAQLATALGAEPRWFGRSRFDAFAVMESANTLRSLTPDFARLREIPARGIIVTCASDDPEFDFLSRFFAPQSGIDEDAVTGSAHCSLGPYWGQRLGKTEMTAWQASSRGGVVRVRLAGDRVNLGGQAITVLEGYLLGV